MFNLVRRAIGRPRMGQKTGAAATAALYSGYQSAVPSIQLEQAAAASVQQQTCPSTVLALCGNDESLASLFELHYRSNLEPFLQEHNISLAELSAMPVVNRRILFLDSLRRAQRWKLQQMQQQEAAIGSSLPQGGKKQNRKKIEKKDTRASPAALSAVEEKLLRRGRDILIENLRIARAATSVPPQSPSPA